MSNIDCRKRIFEGNEKYYIGQTTVLSLMLTIVFIFNLLALVVTYYTKTSSRCNLSRILSGSYLGNIMAGFSLYSGEMTFYPKGENQIGCSDAEDKHFFLYMGVAANLIILLINTYVRYSMLKKIGASKSSFEIFVRYLIPGWLISALVAAIALIIEIYNRSYFLFITIGIMMPLLIFVIVLNLRLTKVLKLGQRNSRNINQPSSENNIRRATAIIENIAYTQIGYMIIWIIIAVLMSKYRNNQIVSITMLWTSRILFFLTFTLEGTIFLHRSPKCRDTIKTFARKIVGLNTKEDDNPSKISVKMSSITFNQ